MYPPTLLSTVTTMCPGMPIHPLGDVDEAISASSMMERSGQIRMNPG
jgi:hypothetical protein